jgi:hypothetical protein
MLDQLAWSISASGISRFEDEVAAYVKRAVRAGAPGHLTSVVSDRSSPDVVRERAFGRLAQFLAGARLVADRRPAA